MKKLLSILLALVISLTMVSGVSAALDDFKVTAPMTIISGQSFDIGVTAMESGGVMPTFNGTINLTIDGQLESLVITNGVGNTSTIISHTNLFDIIAISGNVSAQINRTAISYELSVSPSSVSETATENVTVNVDESITLSNTGTENLTSINVVYTGFETSRATFTGFESSLASGSQDLGNFVYDVSGLLAGTYTGTITFTANGGVSESISVTITIEAPSEDKLLYIDEVEINGERYKLSDYENNEDLVVDAKDIYGEDLEIKVILKNDDDTQDMDDVDLEVEIEDIDDEDDWEDDKDIGTIKDGDEEEVTFTANIDWTSDEDTFRVTVSVTGEGEDDNLDYEDEWSFDLKIDKEDDDIEITEAELDYSTVEAGEMAYLQIEITNIGADDQNDAVILVECDELYLDFLDKNIDIDEGESYTITIPISVDDDADYTSYNIEISVYYEWDEYMDEDLTDYDKVTLTVEGEQVEEEEEEEYVPEGSVIIVPEETIPSGIPTTEEISFRETTSYTILLVLGAILLMTMIVFLLVQVFKR